MTGGGIKCKKDNNNNNSSRSSSSNDRRGQAEHRGGNVHVRRRVGRRAHIDWAGAVRARRRRTRRNNTYRYIRTCARASRPPRRPRSRVLEAHAPHAPRAVSGAADASATKTFVFLTLRKENCGEGGAGQARRGAADVHVRGGAHLRKLGARVPVVVLVDQVGLGWV